MDARALYQSLYDLDLDPTTWNARLVEALALDWPREQGRVGFGFEVQDGHIRLVGAPASPDGVPMEQVAAGIEGLEGLARGGLPRLFDALVVGTLSERLAVLGAKTVQPGSLGPGIGDTAGFCAADRSGAGFILVSYLATPRTMPERRRRRLAQVAAHVTAARRLRHRLGPGEALERAVAVWDRGRLTHLTRGMGAERERLDDAVQPHLEQAGTRALAELPALIRGRWSIVRVGDTDGRHFVVAVENPVGVPPLAGVSERQGQVLELLLQGHSQTFISYELGLAQSTVAHHLASLRSFFRVANDVELVRTVQALTAGRTTSAGGASIAVLPPLAVRAPGLSPSEAEVVEAVEEGLTDAAIAARRGTSVKTVRNQLHRLYKRLGVGSRVELVARLGGAAGSGVDPGSTPG